MIESELQPEIDLARAFASTIRTVYVEREPRPLSAIRKFNLNTLQMHFDDIPHYVHSASLVSSFRLVISTINSWIYNRVDGKNLYI